MKIKSKALEVNIADYSVEVSVDPKYAVLQEVMAKYYGLREGLNTFLKELSHPYKNWRFIIKEARSFSLDYFHLLKTHAHGAAAAQHYVNIFFSAVETTDDKNIKADAVDNLLLFIQKIIKDSGKDLENFIPLLDDTFHRLRATPDEYFFLIIKSFYQIIRLGEEMLRRSSEN